MNKLKWDLSFLLHNVFLHPLAGVCWFLGLERAGDYIHSSLVEETEPGKAHENQDKKHPGVGS